MVIPGRQVSAHTVLSLYQAPELKPSIQALIELCDAVRGCRAGSLIFAS